MEPRPIELRKHGVRLEVQALEARIAPSHLGHEVILPPAAGHGEQGLLTAVRAPASHHRGTVALVGH